MRARSVHLVTSWWVVGVWAALGICTGFLGVVTVLQPSWYVRYTFIHAQEARDVSFQVAVSSVGPLGYCRLSSVDIHDNINTPTTFEVQRAVNVRNFDHASLFETSNVASSYGPPWISEETFPSTKPTPSTFSTAETNSVPTTIIALPNTSIPVGETLLEPTPPLLPFGSSAFDFPPPRNDPSFEKEVRENKEEENVAEIKTKDKEDKKRKDNLLIDVFDGEKMRIEEKENEVKLDRVLSTTTEIIISAEKETQSTNIQTNIEMKEKNMIKGANETETEESTDDGSKIILYKDLHALDAIVQATRSDVQGALSDPHTGKQSFHVAEMEPGVTQEPKPAEDTPKEEYSLSNERNPSNERLEGKGERKIDNDGEFIDKDTMGSARRIKERRNYMDVAGMRRRRRKHKKNRGKGPRKYKNKRREKGKIIGDMDHYKVMTDRKKLFAISTFIRNKTVGSSSTPVSRLRKHGDVANHSTRKTEISTQPSLPTSVISELSKVFMRRGVRRKGHEDQRFRSAQLRSSRITNRSTGIDIYAPKNEQRITNYEKSKGTPERALGAEKRTPEVKVRDEQRIIAEFLRQQEEQFVFPVYGRPVEFKYQPRTPILVCSGVRIGIRSGTSAVWVLVGVLYGTAGIVQMVAGVASLATQIVRSPARRFAFAIWVSNVQVAVVMTQGVMLVLFPLGLGSPLARGECGGSSSVYWPGDCSFGWAYMLAVVATTLAAYCPCLARLTVYRKYALREWESLNFF